jgi:hypothetical protein
MNTNKDKARSIGRQDMLTTDLIDTDGEMEEEGMIGRYAPGPPSVFALKGSSVTGKPVSSR